MINNTIKVVFLLKRNSPLNLKQMEYFIATGNYVTAHEKALKQLKADIKEHCLRYYDGVVMANLPVIE